MITPIPSYIKKITTLKDKSLQLVVETQDLTPETKTYLFEMHDSYGWMIYFKNAPKLEDIQVPEGNAPENKEGKSPAQRLHAVLFVLWKQSGGQGDFDFFYKQEMEKIIDGVKEKREPL